MWLAIKIREFFRIKSMWDDPVDAAHQQMIRDPFHGLQPLVPSVGAECLTHHPPLLFRIQMCRGGSQLRQSVVIKLPVATAGIECIMMIVHPRNDLPADDVDPGKIHILLPAEIVTCPISQPGMGAVVLNGMTQIPDTVIPAPVSDHLCKILIVQPCDQIHILQPDLRLLALRLHPQKRKETLIEPQFLFQPVSPGKNHIASDPALCSLDVPEPWLIGEKSLYRLSELFLIVPVMRLIDLVDQYLRRFPDQRVQIILRSLFPSFL